MSNVATESCSNLTYSQTQLILPTKSQKIASHRIKRLFDGVFKKKIMAETESKVVKEVLHREEGMATVNKNGTTHKASADELKKASEVKNGM
jgi:transcriptional regulator CtsR